MPPSGRSVSGGSASRLAGPALGSILTVVATSRDTALASTLLVVYAVGAAIPMLAIAHGGQAVTSRVRSIARESHRGCSRGLASSSSPSRSPPTFNTTRPAQSIADRNGKIVFQHDGEGQYEQMDRTIARLLNASS
jgi:hypothetical protein